MSISAHNTDSISELAASGALSGLFAEAKSADVSTFWRAAHGTRSWRSPISGCAPCRWMHPVLRKLAVEFSTPTFLLDGDTEKDFVRSNGIDGYPTVLFYRDGERAEIVEGYEKYNDLRTKVIAFLGHSTRATASEAEREFAAAIERARMSVDVAMEPASLAIEPYIAIAAPLLQSHWESFKREVEEGRLSLDEARQRQRAERQRLYAPFQDKIEALQEAQEAAMLSYEAEAERITRDFGGATSRQFKGAANAALVCEGNACRIV